LLHFEIVKSGVRLTTLEEYWPPSFARSLVPKLARRQARLPECLTYYNADRPQTGRHTQGRISHYIVWVARKLSEPDRERPSRLLRNNAN
jgi:hypothetical protein